MIQLANEPIVRSLGFRTATKRTLVLAAGFLLLALRGQKTWGQEAPTTQPIATPVFTEDFESGVLNPDIWAQRLGTGATVAVQQDVVAHGKNALVIHYPAGVRSYAFIVAGHLPDSLKEHFFGRAYVQFPKAPPPGHLVFITAGTEGWPASNFLEIGNRQNKAQLSFQQNAPSTRRAETMRPGPVYPVGKWFCLEWEFNDNPDSITMWIDGEKLADVKVPIKETPDKETADHLIKGFAEFGFGFRSWGNVPNGFDVYYDDIVLGTGRIGPEN